MLNYAPQTTRLMKKIFTIAGRLLNLFLELFFYEYGFFLYRKHEKYGCYDSWGNFKISVIIFFNIRPPPELLPMLAPLER